MAVPKKLGWIIFLGLLYFDAFLDIVRGAEGNPLWQPVIDRFGINAVLILVPLILPLFYLATKAGGWLIEKVDKFPNGEGIVLTNLILAYGTYDILVLLADFSPTPFARSLFQPHYKIIPVLIIAVIPYNLWLEIQKSKGRLGGSN